MMPEQISEVLKVQWPIIGHSVLIYNEDRSVYATVHCSLFEDNDEVEAYLKEELKTYIMGYIDENNKLHIESFLAEQDYPSW